MATKKQNAIRLTEDESRVILEDHIKLLRTSMDDSEEKAFEGWTDRLKKKIRNLRQKNRKSAKAVELEWHLGLIEGERDEEASLTGCTYKELAFHFDFLHMLQSALQDDECTLLPKLTKSVLNSSEDSE